MHSQPYKHQVPGINQTCIGGSTCIKTPASAISKVSEYNELQPGPCRSPFHPGSLNPAQGICLGLKSHPVCRSGFYADLLPIWRLVSWTGPGPRPSQEDLPRDEDKRTNPHADSHSHSSTFTFLPLHPAVSSRPLSASISPWGASCHGRGSNL